MNIDLPMALKAPFNFSEVFFYSHGWWTDATGAMKSYNKFGIGFAKTIVQGLANAATLPPHLAVGIHWPSMFSEEPSSLLNKVELLSYWTMEKRADNVGENAGYAFLRTVLQNKQKSLRCINLVGHSFGCKVVLSTLQEMIKDKLSTRLPVNVILLQAACDDDDLSPDDIYGKVVKGFPNLRMLITTSTLDKALGEQYPMAGRINLFHSVDRKALGAVGPIDKVKKLFPKKEIGQITVDAKFNANQQGVADILKHKLVVADLSAIHGYRNRTKGPDGKPLYEADPNSGSHCDIYFEQLYSLIAKFLY